MKNRKYFQSGPKVSPPSAAEERFLLLTVLFEIAVAPLCIRRTSRNIVPEISGTLSHAQLAAFSPEALTDADPVFQIFRKSFLLKTSDGGKQVCIAGGTGIHFVYQLPDPDQRSRDRSIRL